MTILRAFLESDAGLALQGLLLVAFLDFVTGVFAALRDGTFALDALAAFLRKHLIGRVAPIALLLVTGYFGGAAGQVFMTAAIAAAAAYVAETAASVLGNLRPPKDGDTAVVAITDSVSTDPVELVAHANPVPTD